jgi:hypothetical protein
MQPWPQDRADHFAGPLGATATQEDVIVVNTYSKAVLRAAIAEFVGADDVDYFPSYEMVMFSPRHLAWQYDERHATDAMIGYVTQVFIDRYLS